MLILALSVVVLVLGIFTLVKGEVALSKTRIVRGGKARAIGVLLVATLPVTLVVGVGAVLIGGDPKNAGMIWTILPVVPLLGIPVLAIVLGFIWAE